MKKLLISSFIILFSATNCMEKATANLSDFREYLNTFLANPDEDLKQALLVVYKDLSENDKRVAKEQLDLYGLSGYEKENIFKQSREFEIFSNDLIKWERFSTTGYFAMLLNSYKRIKDSIEKSTAENLIQGILSTYDNNSSEFQMADKALSEHHQRDLQNEHAKIDTFKNSNEVLTKQLDNVLEKSKVEQENNRFLLEVNAKLKAEINQLQFEYNNLMSDLNLTNSTQNLEQLENENKGLSAEYQNLLKEIEALKIKKAEVRIKEKREKEIINNQYS